MKTTVPPLPIPLRPDRRRAARLAVLLPLLALVALPAALAPGIARADGFIIVDREELHGDIVAPHPHHWPQHRRVLPKWFPLQVRSHKVDVKITDALATTVIDQVFYNPNRIQLEGTYMFPMPAGAAFDRFTLFMNGKEVAGEVLDKDKARHIYEDIVRRMKDPALIEYMNGGMFKARIFPIPAMGETRVKITYSQVLGSEGGLTEYRYPLATEKFSSAPLETLSIACRVETKGELSTIYSPTHEVDVTRHGMTGATVGLEQRSVVPKRDFQLFFGTTGKDVGLSLLTHHAAGEDGYFLALISPRYDIPKDRVQPKDIVFVLDTSGSMADDGKIDQARAALRNVIARLPDVDRIDIIEFATEARSFREGLIAADGAGKEAARAYVDGLEARGGTNIDEALKLALRPLQGRDSTRPYYIVFLTDGQPTVGITQMPELLKGISAANQERARIFVFGVGYDVNTHLLDKLAEENRGSRQYVSPKENIEVKVSAFYDKVASPVLTDLAMEIDGVWTKDVYPRRIPDLFRGEQLVLMGRYQGTGSHAVRLTGSFLGERREFAFDASFPESARQEALPRLWAMRKVAYLLDQIRLHGESKELKDEVVRVAKKHGVITPYTSYLVMEEGELAGGGGRAPRVRRLIEERLGRAPAPARDRANDAPGAMGDSEGKSSQGLSLRLKKARGGASLGAAEEADDFGGFERELRIDEVVQHVAEKTFYLDGEVWVDSAVPAEQDVRRIEYLSEAYFALLKAEPALAPYLSLGQKVRVLHGGVVYEVL